MICSPGLILEDLIFSKVEGVCIDRTRQSFKRGEDRKRHEP